MLPKTSQLKDTLWKLTTVMFLGALVLAGPLAESRGRARGTNYRQTRSCSAQSLSSSMYFVPKQSDYRSFAAFQAEVKIEGTGKMSDGTHVLRYDGAIQSLHGCSTAIGAAGRCLTPFFSIAADLSKYRKGDIIYVPEMRGRQVTLPAPRNTVITHPGYFIVDDTGGAIKGANRFDFFTGDMGPRNSSNAFGIKNAIGAQGGESMADKHSCDKTFQVIRQGSPGWQAAYNSINDSYLGRTSVPAAGSTGQGALATR